MANFKPSTYVKPTAPEKVNPFIDAIKEYTDKGIDTPFDVTFTAAEYKAEKLLIQKAANKHGFTAREVATDYDEEKSGKTPVKSTFIVRPGRKSKDTATESVTEGE